MKALVGTGSTGLLQLVEVPDPPPPPRGEVTIAVRYFSLNRGELHRLHEKPPGWRPGWDFVGTVATTSPGAGLIVGQWVCGLLPEGAWAQFLNAPIDHLTPLPAGADPLDAACVPVAGLTAKRILALAGRLVARKVLVVGAAGGVGQFAVRLACDAGAQVAGLTSSPARYAAIERAGARPLLRSELDTLADEFDIVLENAGGATLAAAVRSLAPGGTVITFGNSERRDTVLPTSQFYDKEATLVGYHLLHDLRRRPPARDLSALLTHMAAGHLTIDRSAAVPWTRTTALLGDLSERRVHGKVVVAVEPGQ